MFPLTPMACRRARCAGTLLSKPYNIAKQLQPPPVDYLLYMREFRDIQNFVIADEMEPLVSQYLTIRVGMEGF